MKRLRHYDKELAVIVSVFGSSEASAMKQYIQVKDAIKSKLSDEIEVRLSVSSRTIMKKLENRGECYLTLPEQLANLDRLGYKKVVVASINIFPTGEHEYIEQAVNAFSTISKAKYEITMPLFARSKQTNCYLSQLNELLRARYGDINIMFMAHGAAYLHSAGNQTFGYVRDYLRLLHSRNYLYTIEGAYGYEKDFILNEIQKENSHNESNNQLLIVPLLLVAGNHYKNDILEMQEELRENLEQVMVPDCYSERGYFSLLMLEETIKYFVEEVEYATKKIIW
jgi:sirohydrochlorin cobaltochelatase